MSQTLPVQASPSSDEISVDEVSKRFEAHLSIEGNYRIIFSGPYGTGKSYFLNKFFESRKEKYNKFTLSPVNYVVSANEDIFELIKVDIIRKLFFDNFIKYEKSERKTKGDAAWQMVHEKPFTTVKHIVEILKKVKPYWEATGAVLTGILELTKEFEKYQKDLKENLKLNAEHLAEFVNTYVEKPGNIFEENFITRTINTQLEQICADNKKENVLIIDDLDRIDPEHIFRILNVLSAHNNYWDEQNKFRFHKIILVCDIENIRETFYHRYGSKVDFEGYIDKFYSTEIFDFSNWDAIKLHIEKNIGSQLSASGKNFLSLILKTAVDCKLLTLRKILKARLVVPNTDYSFAQLSMENAVTASVPFLSVNTKASLNFKDFEILKVIKLLTMIWGDYKSLMEGMTQLKDRGPAVRYMDYQSFFDYLVLPSHISKRFPRADMLFSTQERYEPSRSRNVTEIDYPKHTCFDLPFKIILNWNAGTPYSADKGYFEQASIHLEADKGYITRGGNRTQLLGVTASIGAACDELRTILVQFEKFKFLQNLGI